ncbi:MAG TPA: lipid-A-disaccharide synthase [Methylophilaceae bacterium]|jgi:lipid-A-disaccharide synthase
MPTIGIVAGEASGDLLGSHLIEALKQRRSDLEFIGIAGPKMMAAGAKTMFSMEKLAVRGYFEVLRHYLGIRKIRSNLIKYFLQNPPDLFIGIDAPDFNLGLEQKLRRNGIKTIHYVSPSIWAWRRNRVKTIKRAVDQVLCLFPFEKVLYEEAGVNATYVGHPLADVIPLKLDKALMRTELQISDAGQVIALLPGSRQSELDYMADLFVKTAMRIQQDVPNVLFLVPLVSRETRIKFELAIMRNQAFDVHFKLLFGHAQKALAAADGAIVASGTATLEAALLKCPMVITYRMSRMSWPLMKRMGYLPWVGLPNIIAGKFLVPELLQDQATPETLADELLQLVFDRKRVTELKKEYTTIHLALQQNNAEKAADAILSQLA